MVCLARMHVLSQALSLAPSRPAIQLARLSKFSPIITTASLHNEGLLKSLGATHVLDRSLAAPALLSSIASIASSTPVPYAYDAIGEASTLLLAYDALGDGGALVTSNPRAAPLLAERVARTPDDGKRLACPIATLTLPANVAVGDALFAHLSDWLRTGEVMVSILLSGYLVP